jgi:hypothetical protein
VQTKNSEKKTSRSDHGPSAAMTFLLGLYLMAVAFVLGFFIYVLWPDIMFGADGKLEWEPTVRVFDSSVALGSEPRLILLVLVVGALGSYVHTATSFVTYAGNRTLRASWTWWYLLRPFIGMALALIFYFLIRGGLLSAGAEASEVSVFGISAVAGLAGMFSKQATDKLQEVFDNLFRTQAGQGDDQRGDKLTGRMSVSEKMIPVNKITTQAIQEGKSAQDVGILDVYNKYTGVVTRLPVVDHRGAVQHAIHQSLVYKFISDKTVESSKSGKVVELAGLSLGDFLASPGMAELVNAIAFVPENATIEEASTAMEKVPKCQDVFVTEHGNGDEPLKGWLTNVDLGRLSQSS